MPSLPGRRSGAGRLLHRAAVSLAVLAVTLFVSVVWQKMVCTIPVLAALLFFAAGINADAGSARQNLDDGSTVPGAGMRADLWPGGWSRWPGRRGGQMPDSSSNGDLHASS